MELEVGYDLGEYDHHVCRAGTALCNARRLRFIDMRLDPDTLEKVDCVACLRALLRLFPFPWKLSLMRSVLSSSGPER